MNAQLVAILAAIFASQARLDGLPRSDRGEPGDPGVAVYWREKAGAHWLVFMKPNVEVTGPERRR